MCSKHFDLMLFSMYVGSIWTSAHDNSRSICVLTKVSVHRNTQKQGFGLIIDNNVTTGFGNPTLYFP